MGCRSECRSSGSILTNGLCFVSRTSLSTNRRSKRQEVLRLRALCALPHRMTHHPRKRSLDEAPGETKGLSTPSLRDSAKDDTRHQYTGFYGCQVNSSLP